MHLSQCVGRLSSPKYLLRVTGTGTTGKHSGTIGQHLGDQMRLPELNRGTHMIVQHVSTEEVENPFKRPDADTSAQIPCLDPDGRSAIHWHWKSSTSRTVSEGRRIRPLL